MPKTRSGKKMHNLFNNVSSKNNKKKTNNYSVTDEIKIIEQKWLELEKVRGM